jgi:hypothetical protein
LSGKTISEYVRDTALSFNLDTAKMEFYQTINESLLDLKKD